MSGAGAQTSVGKIGTMVRSAWTSRDRVSSPWKRAIQSEDWNVRTEGTEHRQNGRNVRSRLKALHDPYKPPHPNLLWQERVDETRQGFMLFRQRRVEDHLDRDPESRPSQRTSRANRESQTRSAASRAQNGIKIGLGRRTRCQPHARRRRFAPLFAYPPFCGRHCSPSRSLRPEQAPRTGRPRSSVSRAAGCHSLASQHCPK